MKRALFQLALIAIVGNANPFVAQPDPCLRRTIAANVFDVQDRMISDLTVDDFQASLGHEPIKILSVTSSDKPRIVIVVAATGSGLDKKSDWDAAMDSAKLLTESLADGAEVGLVVISSRLELTHALTRDHQFMLRDFDRLKSDRHQLIKSVEAPPFWDAMAQALSLFGPLVAGDTLYVISNGRDFGSRLRPADFERYASGVRMFALVPYPIAIINSREGSEDKLLHLVSRSGGSGLVFSTEYDPDKDAGPNHISFASVLTGDLFLGARKRQIQRVATFYRIQIELPRPIESKSEWNLKLTRKSGLSIQGPYVAYPALLWPCEQRPESAESVH